MIDEDKFKEAFMRALPAAHEDVKSVHEAVGSPMEIVPLAAPSGASFCDILTQGEKAIDGELWLIKLFAPKVAQYITAIEAAVNAIKPDLCGG